MSDASSDRPGADSTDGSPDPPRRSVLASMLALAVGGLISIFPFAVGATVVLDPWLRNKRRAKTIGGSGEAGDHSEPESSAEFRRVASLNSVPMDHTPIKATVLADDVDAWNRDPNQPIGAVYLRRKSQTEVQAFNAICPHAGCFVAYSKTNSLFLCPCHNSAFKPDGAKTNFQGKTNPSPRTMDELAVEIRNGEIWVQFENFYPGQHEKEAKA